MEHLVLYDGACGFCHASVRFVIPRDRRRLFAFAPLQSRLAAEALARHGRDPARLETLVVLERYGTPEERALIKSRAALFIASTFGGPWRLLAPLQWIPRFLGDAVYDLVAKYRLRIFGRADVCALPSAEDRARFLSDPPPAA